MSRNVKRDTSDSRIASLKMLDKEYNEMYRKWRIENKNEYGFYYLDRSDEFTYRDGEGFITEYPEAAERSAVNAILSIVAKTLIIYTLLNLLATLVFTVSPLPVLLGVEYNSADYFSGNETNAIILSYAVNIIIRILPLFYLLSKIKMPIKLVMPLKVTNKPLFYEAVPMAMFIFGIATILSGAGVYGAAILGFDTSHKIWIPENRTVFILYSIMTILIIPIMSEIVHRGIFMQVFKQFGDGFALIATSIIAALVTGNVNSMFFTFVYSLVVGYFSVRSGSILTAMLMRIVISASTFVLTYIRFINLPEGVSLTISVAVILIYLIVGIVSMVIFMKNHSNKINLPLYGMYLSENERLMCCLVNPSVMMWLALTILYITLKIGML